MVHSVTTSITRRIFGCILLCVILMEGSAWISYRELGREMSDVTREWSRFMASTGIRMAAIEEARKYDAAFSRMGSACTMLAMGAAGQYAPAVQSAGLPVSVPGFRKGNNGEVLFDSPDPAIITAFWGADPSAPDVAREYAGLSRLDRFMDRIRHRVPESLAIYVMNRSGIGRCLAADGSGIARAMELFSVPGIAPGHPGAGAIWSGIPSDHSGPVWATCPSGDQGRILSVQMPVVDDSGSVRGLAGLDLPMDAVAVRCNCTEEMSGDTGCMEKGEMARFLVDDQGMVLAFPGRLRELFGFTGAPDQAGFLRWSDSQIASVRDAGERLAMMSGQLQVVRLSLGGETHLLAAARLQETGWTLVLAANEKALAAQSQNRDMDLVAVNDRTWNKHLTVTAMLLVLMAGCVFLLASRLLAPIRQMTASASEVGNGNFEIRTEIDRKDEIGGLASAFNTMVGKIQNRVVQGEDREKMLEALIRERTWELEQANQELQDTRDALEEKVQERTQELKQLNEYLSITEVRERRRIAEYLHDGIAQTLGICISQLKSFTEEPESARKINLPEIQSSLERSVREIRSLTYQLSPPILYDFDLDIALGWLSEEMNRQYNLKIAYSNDLDRPLRLEDLKKEVLYRSVHELIMNIVKHAGSQDAVLRIRFQESSVIIELQDFGQGFDASTAGRMNYTSFGIFSITERLKSIKGTATFTSEAGYGTRVVLAAPVDDRS